MDKKSLQGMIIRYAILLILAINGLAIIYFVMTPLTIYASFGVMKLFSPEAFITAPNIINFAGEQAILVPACIAGAAYYLLLILNLTTPMPRKTRVSSLIFLLSSFFIINILRIVSFGYLYISGHEFFDLTHSVTWYFGSTSFVIILWFIAVKKYKIKNIPAYTDIKSIILDTRHRK